MEIKIEDYLSNDEIKIIVADEIRNNISSYFKNEENANRLLINISYEIIKDEINKIVPDYENVIIDKTVSIIKDESSIGFCLFDFDKFGSGRAKSLGAKIVEQAVSENQQLIKDIVVKNIQNRDYSEDAWIKFESLAEQFTSNIYDFVELIKSKK